MDNEPEFPSGANGDVLRRMYLGGDDLGTPRMIDFYFLFRQRRQAIAFAEIVDDRDCEVRVAYHEEREMWEVTVQRFMMPTHGDVTSMEAALTAKADSVGGEPDGWGCMQVPRDTK